MRCDKWLLNCLLQHCSCLQFVLFDMRFIGIMSVLYRFQLAAHLFDKLVDSGGVIQKVPQEHITVNSKQTDHIIASRTNVLLKNAVLHIRDTEVIGT